MYVTTTLYFLMWLRIFMYVTTTIPEISLITSMDHSTMIVKNGKETEVTFLFWPVHLKETGALID